MGDNVATVNYSVSPADSKQSTGSDILFEYLSFDFETYGVPNGNQNELKIECQVTCLLKSKSRCDCRIRHFFVLTILRNNCFYSPNKMFTKNKKKKKKKKKK